MKISLVKDHIKDLYLQGFNATEITHMINSQYDGQVKKDTVQKYIQRNLRNFKGQHELRVIARRETLKAVNYESKKFMSDKSFIQKNRSIYITKNNGDIVLNNKLANLVTWDTPRRLTNENKVAI